MGARLAHSQRGFTLIEVLVASVVIVVGLVAIQQSLTGAWRMYRKGSEASEATLLRWNKAVEFRLAPSETGTTWPLVPGLRPLQSVLVKVDGSPIGWEVLHAR